MRHSIIAVTAVTLTLLTACATSEYEKDPMYGAGFSDGCATGTARAQGAPPSKPVRDQSDWDNSEAYRAGWRAGYGSCSPAGRSDTMGTDRDPTRPY